MTKLQELVAAALEAHAKAEDAEAKMCDAHVKEGGDAWPHDTKIASSYRRMASSYRENASKRRKSASRARADARNAEAEAALASLLATQAYGNSHDAYEFCDYCDHWGFDLTETWALKARKAWEQAHKAWDAVSEEYSGEE